MRRSTGMALTGHSMPMVRRGEVDLASNGGAGGHTDEQQSDNLTSFTGHNGQHKAPTVANLLLPLRPSHVMEEKRGQTLMGEVY